MNCRRNSGTPDSQKRIALLEGTHSASACPSDRMRIIKMWVNIEYWLNLRDKEIGITLRKKCLCYFLDDKYDIEWSGIESGPP